MLIDFQNESDTKKSEVVRKKRNEMLHTQRPKVQEEANHQIKDRLNDLQECNSDSNNCFRALRLIDRMGQFQRQLLLKRNYLKI